MRVSIFGLFVLLQQPLVALSASEAVLQSIGVPCSFFLRTLQSAKSECLKQRTRVVGWINVDYDITCASRTGNINRQKQYKDLY